MGPSFWTWRWAKTGLDDASRSWSNARRRGPRKTTALPQPRMVSTLSADTDLDAQAPKLRCSAGGDSHDLQQLRLREIACNCLQFPA